MAKFYTVNIKHFTEERGCLIPFEFGQNCPFEIKRAFIIKDVPDIEITRGNHINTKSKCFIIPLQGSVNIDCEEAQTKETFILNNNCKGLFIDCGVYRKLYNFSNNAIILCLSDNKYNSDEFTDKIS